MRAQRINQKTIYYRKMQAGSKIYDINGNYTGIIGDTYTPVLSFKGVVKFNTSEYHENKYGKTNQYRISILDYNNLNLDIDTQISLDNSFTSYYVVKEVQPLLDCIRYYCGQQKN